MPAGFDACRKNGGKIRTKQMGGGKYMHICILNGKSFSGEVKSTSTSTSGKSNVAEAIKQKMEKK